MTKTERDALVRELELEAGYCSDAERWDQSESLADIANRLAALPVSDAEPVAEMRQSIDEPDLIVPCLLKPMNLLVGTKLYLAAPPALPDEVAKWDEHMRVVKELNALKASQPAPQGQSSLRDEMVRFVTEHAGTKEAAATEFWLRKMPLPVDEDQPGPQKQDVGRELIYLLEARANTAVMNYNNVKSSYREGRMDEAGEILAEAQTLVDELRKTGEQP